MAAMEPFRVDPASVVDCTFPAGSLGLMIAPSPTDVPVVQEFLRVRGGAAPSGPAPGARSD